MISTKLKKLLGISLLLIYAHGLEEIITGFYPSDRYMIFFSSLFASIPQATYWISHLLFWVFLLISYLLVIGGRWKYFVLALFGTIFFIELHHPIDAFLTGGYYPGMITALIYPFIGFFYWKQLITDWKSNNKGGDA